MKRVSGNVKMMNYKRAYIEWVAFEVYHNRILSDDTASGKICGISKYIWDKLRRSENELIWYVDDDETYIVHCPWIELYIPIVCTYKEIDSNNDGYEVLREV